MTNELESVSNGSVPVQAAVSAETVPVKRSTGPTMLERLFAMSLRYRKEGNLRQASEMFWTLVQDHPDTPQAEAAKAELLLLAESYERAGNQHMARGMYERLMDLED